MGALSASLIPSLPPSIHASRKHMYRPIQTQTPSHYWRPQDPPVPLRLPPTIGDLKILQFSSDSLPLLLLATSGSSSSPQTPSHYWRHQDPPVPLRLPPTIAIDDFRISQFPSD